MILSLVFIFLFGLIVGSFLNAVIWRTYSRTPLWQGRSMCPTCRHTLSWQDLIPVASFFLLRARCRYCAIPISWQYPLVELATAVLFLAMFYFSVQGGFGLFYLWFIAASLIVIFVYDLKHYIIPDVVVFPAIAITLFYHLIVSNFEFRISNFIFSGVAAAVFFLIIVLISRGRWMGLGDVKLALLMGLVLGFPRIIVAIFFAFVVGALLSLFLIFFKKKQWKSQVPFAPFLVLGTFLALFFGAPIVNWYLSMFLPL